MRERKREDGKKKARDEMRREGRRGEFGEERKRKRKNE